MVQRFAADLGRHQRVFEQRLDLGAEHQVAGAVGVVQRFDADAVTVQQQAAFAVVPDRDSEHAFETVDEAFTPVPVGVENGFGVGARPVGVARRFELRSQRGVIVDFPVEHQRDAAVGSGHRLMSRGGEVDDGQPPERQSHIAAFRDEFPVVIRSAMRDRGTHAPEKLPGDFRTLS